MITDRTLLAYEQFCEEYYDNFDVLGRSTISKHEYTHSPTSHLSDDRKSNLKAASKVKWMIGSDHPRYKDMPSYMGDAYYDLDNKRLNKLRMKRDPEYKAKRLAEISARKETNSARHQKTNENQKFDRKVNDLLKRLNIMG